MIAFVSKIDVSMSVAQHLCHILLLHHLINQQARHTVQGLLAILQPGMCIFACLCGKIIAYMTD